MQTQIKNESDMIWVRAAHCCHAMSRHLARNLFCHTITIFVTPSVAALAMRIVFVRHLLH